MTIQQMQLQPHHFLAAIMEALPPGQIHDQDGDLLAEIAVSEDGKQKTMILSSKQLTKTATSERAMQVKALEHLTTGLPPIAITITEKEKQLIVTQ